MTIPKFRAWLKDEYRMTDVREITFFDDEVQMISDVTDFYTYGEFELMQSTGLVDENGKEIFEGDVIRDSDGFEGIVQYDESYGMYGIAYLPTLSNGIDMTFEELKDNFRNKFEVIGNIYENPDLVEEEK